MRSLQPAVDLRRTGVCSGAETLCFQQCTSRDAPLGARKLGGRSGGLHSAEAHWLALELIRGALICAGILDANANAIGSDEKCVRGAVYEAHRCAQVQRLPNCRRLLRVSCGTPESRAVFLVWAALRMYAALQGLHPS